MTTAMIQAILSLLIAFNVDVATVNNIRVILTPPQASTTPVTIVPVIQTPLIENQPVQFGSVVPVQPIVDNPQPEPAPVVALKSMADIIIPEPRLYPTPTKGTPYGYILFVGVGVLYDNGVNKFLADVSMNDGDGVIINQQTNTQSGTNKNDWTATFSYAPKSAGDKILTFTSGDLTKTYNYKAQ